MSWGHFCYLVFTSLKKRKSLHSSLLSFKYKVICFTAWSPRYSLGTCQKEILNSCLCIDVSTQCDGRINVWFIQTACCCIALIWEAHIKAPCYKQRWNLTFFFLTRAVSLQCWCYIPMNKAKLLSILPAPRTPHFLFFKKNLPNSVNYIICCILWLLCWLQIVLHIVCAHPDIVMGIQPISKKLLESWFIYYQHCLFLHCLFFTWKVFNI